MQRQERQTKSNSHGNEIEEGGGRMLQVSNDEGNRKMSRGQKMLTDLFT